MSVRYKLNSLKIIHDYHGTGYIYAAYKYFFGDKTINVYINNTKIKLNISNALHIIFLLNNGWSVTNIEGDFLTLENRREGINIVCRASRGAAMLQLREIFIDEIYSFDVKGKVVVDVGMNNGDSSIYFAKRGAKKVIGLEPDLESFNLAIRNIKASNVEGIVVPLNKALALGDGKIKFYVYQGSNWLNRRTISKDVDTISLDSILKIAGERIGLLKMDCEGCEYSILRNSNIDKVDAIIMEYHNGLQNLPEILQKNGFNVEVKDKKARVSIMKAYRV